MKINSKKTTAIAVAAVMSLGMFAGCDLVLKNNTKNLSQTVATVNITDSDSFSTEFASLDSELTAKVISTASVSKLDMIELFLLGGYSQYISYGYSYEFVFNAISESLVQRQLYVQYAKAYFLANGWTDEEGVHVTYDSLTEFNKAVTDPKTGEEYTGIDYDIATLKYFLTEEECKKVDYTTRVMFNNSIDANEDDFIDLDEDEDEDHDHDHDVRTTPTGIDTKDSDYYDEHYTVYTGTGAQKDIRGSYEKKDGSTATTRLRAYNKLIERLQDNNFIQKGEDTSNIESLNYYKRENKSDYEDALLQKLTDTFTAAAEAKIDETYCQNKFEEILGTQRKNFSASYSNLESAMDSMSDTSFVLTATGNGKEESAYGFVINILLPFSASQTAELNSVSQDYGDKKGNKFATRARLLEYIKATDQRGSWFRGETDYSFKADDEAYGVSTEGQKREWLFFEDYLKEGDNVQYERLSNYLGKYTYNGTWDEETRKYKPYSITIDGFIEEMEGYLDYALETNVSSTSYAKGYYKYDPTHYYKKNKNGTNVDWSSVDYEKFVYHRGSVGFAGNYDANKIFQKESQENIAFSVINELSFAYNTDTGGLNSYLGYAVTANKTNFVNEFEYAAQDVVLKGAGNYIVVPSDYGWHIIYCTFSFVDSQYEVNGIKTPFHYDESQKDEEGTFSYLFYESLKADTATKESSNRRQKIVSSFKDSYTILNERFKDLTNPR